MTARDHIPDAGLEELERHWNAWGEEDPFWAILSVPELRGNRWDVERFFATGVTEVDAVVRRLDVLGPQVRRRRALDFGCGVGRVTQALADRFEECDGVDIATSMVALARRLNRHGPRCRYHLNTQPHLGLFDDATFDFVYSNIVLQHMQPALSTNYLREFVRVLVPGGVAAFQLPSELAEGAAAPTDAAPEPEAVDGLPLPDEAFRARLDAPASLELEPGQRFALGVTVTNVSPLTWPAGGSSKLSLCNAWLAEGDARWRDAEVGLPHTIRPGESADLLLTVHAPEDAGSYVMELDLVQENVAWFADKGSPPAQVRVEVGGASRSRAETSFEPMIEMWGVPREEIVDLVCSSGGEVLAVDEDVSAGPGWVGYRYVIGKA